MPDTPKSALRKLLLRALALLPWIVSMFALYWLETSGTWNLDTPHRGKLSVTILALGMGLSFLLLSRLNRNP